jgi:hypothetical protein
VGVAEDSLICFLCCLDRFTARDAWKCMSWWWLSERPKGLKFSSVVAMTCHG